MLTPTPQRPARAINQIVGVPRIELGLPAPKAGVLPVYYTPTIKMNPEAHVLPLYYTPTIFLTPNTYSTTLSYI